MIKPNQFEAVGRPIRCLTSSVTLEELLPAAQTTQSCQSGTGGRDARSGWDDGQ